MKIYKQKKGYRSKLEINEATEGESIEAKVFRALTSEEGIEETANIIYTERKDGVLPEYDPRADKFDIAIEAMSKIDHDNKVRRLERQKPVDRPDENPDVKGSEGGA